VPRTRLWWRVQVARRRSAEGVGETVNIYTAREVAGMLKVEYKTVLRLIQRGLLKAIPGIRHKRITEQELRRYLGIKETQGGAA
jgi:excisionase family DNA binding protein